MAAYLALPIVPAGNIELPSALPATSTQDVKTHNPKTSTNHPPFAHYQICTFAYFLLLIIHQHPLSRFINSRC
jgi:hypothetical protein